MWRSLDFQKAYKRLFKLDGLVPDKHGVITIDPVLAVGVLPPEERYDYERLEVLSPNQLRNAAVVTRHQQDLQWASHLFLAAETKALAMPDLDPEAAQAYLQETIPRFFPDLAAFLRLSPTAQALIDKEVSNPHFTDRVCISDFDSTITRSITKVKAGKPRKTNPLRQGIDTFLNGLQTNEAGGPYNTFIACGSEKRNLRKHFERIHALPIADGGGRQDLEDFVQGIMIVPGVMPVNEDLDSPEYMKVDEQRVGKLFGFIFQFLETYLQTASRYRSPVINAVDRANSFLVTDQYFDKSADRRFAIPTIAVHPKKGSAAYWLPIIAHLQEIGGSIRGGIEKLSEDGSTTRVREPSRLIGYQRGEDGKRHRIYNPYLWHTPDDRYTFFQHSIPVSRRRNITAYTKVGLRDVLFLDRIPDYARKF